jgi:hypothetical protein
MPERKIGKLSFAAAERRRKGESFKAARSGA